jgi:hypothetical protein
MPEPLVFRKSARRPAGLITAAIAMTLLGILTFAVGAHPLTIAAFALLTVPAFWEIARDSQTELIVDETTLSWKSGNRTGQIPLSEIDVVRIRTALDFSQRASLTQRDGQKLRLPPECLPGGRAFDLALEQRGVAVRRVLFTA